MSRIRKDGVSMVWHYNAFLSYEAKPVEEKRVWLDPETANMTQVDVNAYLLENAVPAVPVLNEQSEQINLAESLYATALTLWEDRSQEEKKALDRRA